MWKFNKSLLKSCRLVVPMLFALAGLGSTLVITTPARAQSEILINSNGTRIDMTLNRQPNESYESLIARAQTNAKNVLTRSFNQNPSAKRVSVTILGQNAGQVVPIMSLNVDRQTWASGQNLQRLATYFPNSRSLLGLRTPASPNNNVANQPQPTNAASVGQTLPNGVRVLPNGIVVTGNGTQVLPNGVVVTNNGGTQVLPNGNVVSVNADVQNSPGNAGLQGFTGNTGVQGVPGNVGGQNAVGNAGVQGVPGNNNANGTVLFNNPGSNNSGVNGLNNTTGVNGTIGTTGVNGINGTTGVNGTIGTTGVNGINGTTGVTGTTGTTGVNGINGTTGVTGTTGTTGVNGINGTTGGQ
ncbi:hypothetical protein IQ264_07285 [Phormidium sp. LEGE 05292]|uniref:hypothetical protein n=1 Tax=[Phormidium] sp. LEGE 05292 TaxID=767427 RepID=UPI0018813BDF|nr:hypothetical protein [Phormidium sp. LEGE 05292]MBE9225234.1 hypothetical protein [Phormidium sp. LEGE 05292]